VFGSVVNPDAAMYSNPVNAVDDVKIPPNSPGLVRLVAL
jgi:hypothetical protein